jgi:hypothetical protein
MSSFYVGYLAKAPTDLRRFLRRTVAAMASLALTLAIVAALGQQRYSPAVFEYTKVRDFTGQLQAYPYPSLLVEDGSSHQARRFLLTAQGKHGFTERVAELDGRPVRLRAKLIYRNEGAMLEVVPNTIAQSSPVPLDSSQNVRIGETVTLTGEIVDTKCFLGVMNPGRGKVHRDCAARCISGGLPPALLVQNASSSELYLLNAEDGGPIDTKRILQYVGEEVKVAGTLTSGRGSRAVAVSKLQRLESHVSEHR